VAFFRHIDDFSPFFSLQLKLYCKILKGTILAERKKGRKSEKDLK